jgi:[ribosomal protein S5]-alanine N-acetyltransferase
MTGVEQRVTENGLALRALGAGDLDFLDRLCSDPEALGPFEWSGFVDVRARRRRWEQDGYASPDSTVLAVVLADGTVAGIASWSTRNRSQPERAACYEIGLALLPEHRGHGLGTAAHRLLVDYLFRFTVVHRLEAITESGNIAEQKALERIGFEREGVLREVAFATAPGGTR